MARFVVQEGPRRREWRGEGGAAPAEALRLARRALGREACRFDRAGRAAGPGIDQVDAERLAWALVDAGLAVVRERRDRRGDWEPYQWRLTPAGEAWAAPTPDLDLPGEVADYLESDDPPGAALLASVRAWLPGAPVRTRPLAVRLALAIAREWRAGRIPRGRLLAVQVGGHSKALRVADHRADLEDAFGAPLEDVVRLHARAVLVSGPVRFTIGGRDVELSWSRPWFALTDETIRDLANLRCDATRLLTIENLMPFEEEARTGLPADTVAVYTGGFPGRAERDFLRQLAAAGIRTADHWGDLDLGGLRILRDVADTLPLPVRPFRMEPELLDRLPTQPLTAADRQGLEAWLRDDRAPARDLARAMLDRGVKAEQEGWYLGRG